LLALALPALWLFVEQSRLRVDVENDALKSPDSVEALALERRIEQFGREVTVMAAFQALPVGAGKLTGVEAKALDVLAAELRALDGVRRLRAWPGTSKSSQVWAIELGNESGEYAELAGEVARRVREGCPAGLKAAVSGQPLAELVISREVRAEQSRVLPLVVGAFVLLLLAYYRHIGLVLAVLGPAALGIVATSGIYALCGLELDPVSVMLQPVLLTVGVAAGVHWVEQYLDLRHESLDTSAAAMRAVRDLLWPAAIATATTVAGFLALGFNAIPAMVDFGVFAALGTALTFVIAVVATPALLMLFASDVSRRLIDRHGILTGNLARRAADWVAHRALAIRAGAVVVGVAGLVAAFGTEVDNDPERVLPAEHEFRRDTAVLASEIGGSDVFELLVPAGSRLADPVEVGLLAAFVLSRPLVAGPAGPALHSTGGDWLVRFVLSPSGSAGRERLFREVEERATALGAPEVLVTGLSVQVARDSERLMWNAILGIGSSVVALFVIFWIAFRSAAYAGLALIPNVLPCIVVYASLALMGRPLSVATAMIGSVLLGLIVDDTIHLLHRYRQRRADGDERLNAIEHVFQHSGRAILITSVVLSVGFAVGMTGSLSTTVEFCGMATATILVALAADAIVLPAILVRAGPAEVARG
jgi:predicted RND superfamily exporter protein